MPARSRRAATVRTIARRFEADLGASVLASGPRIPNVRQISERVAMGRALWRELVVGFASQLGELGRMAGEPVVRDLKLHAFTAVVGSVGLDGEQWYDVAFIALSANPVAAFPSLHSAFAFLSFLVLARAFGAWGRLGLAYFGAVAFTIVYSGDHYVIDVVGGVVYASAAYWLMWRLAGWRGRAQAPTAGTPSSPGSRLPKK